MQRILIRVIRRTPLWIQVLVIALGWTALHVLFDLLRGEGIDTGETIFRMIVGVFLGCLMIWMVFRQRAKEQLLPPASPTESNISAAMSTGHVPEGALAGDWVPQLQKTLRQERPMVWAGPLLFGLFTALGAFLMLEDPDHPWFGGLAAAASLGTAVWYPLWIRRRRVQIQGLLDQFPADHRLHQ